MAAGGGGVNAVSNQAVAGAPAHFDFRRRLGEGFDGGEYGELRAIDRAVARWVLAHGGSTRLAHVAAAASRADGEGDSVLILTGEGSGRFIAALEASTIAALAAEPLVASSDQATLMASLADGDIHTASPGWAFVLDGNQFYLRRSFAHEQALASMLRLRRKATCLDAGDARTGTRSAAVQAELWPNSAAQQPFEHEEHAGTKSTGDIGTGGIEAAQTDAVGTAQAPAVATWVDALFNGDRSEAVQAQRRAVASFAQRPLFVLTGGPGTGKTATVLRMLLLRMRLHQQRFGAFPRLRLAAPTGKAAQRLAESLQSGAASMRANGLGVEWQPALDHVLAAEAGTLHRLLGSRGPARGHAWHRDRRLPLDLLVVDEASMVDLALLRASFEALADEAAVLLVGDADQLASVGTGSVLRDLVEALEADPRNDLVRLRHSFRAEATLRPLNTAIAAGDIAALLQASDAAGAAFELVSVTDARTLQNALHSHAQRLQAALAQGGVFEALPDDASEQSRAATRAHAALREVQLLCALRQGPFGALACDTAIDLALKRLLGLPDGQAWYPGRAVIVLQNDYAAGLFNGDIGLCLNSPDGGLRVWFEARGKEGASLRGLAPGALPHHGGGFALSVHKSQGSEYGEVALLLPPEPDHPILGRALLYTGATRARRALRLWATEPCLRTALSRPTQRVSGLASRLLQHRP